MTDPIDYEWFQSERSRLFAIAYRMLATASDAEDVVQDAWLRLAAVDRRTVESPQALATTIVTRLCLDRLKSARSRREQYVGPWLPEPVLTDDTSPDALLERAESVTLAFLLLLDTLSAEERAVFVLKELFEFDHTEIGRMLGVTPANSRQLLHRAKAKVREQRTSTREAVDARRAVAERFARALHDGNADVLTQLLTADCVLVSDGGGKAAAARRPLHGRDDVLRLLVGLRRSAEAMGLAGAVSLHLATVNAEAAVVVRLHGKVDGVFVLSIADERITNLRVIRNPDKLAFLARQLAASQGEASGASDETH
jgi:RNA polymerase sigma-70 factor (ECF subfamily)